MASKYVYGKNSVKALLDANPERVYKIFLSDSLKPDKRVQAIQELAHNFRIPVQRVPRQKLDQMMRTDSELSAESARNEELQREGGRGPDRDFGKSNRRPGHDRSPDRAIAFVPDATDEANHQGVVASVAPKALLDMQDLLKITRAKAETGQYPRLLMLDGVTDPRNFGAILRVADAAGVDGVIVPKHNSAGFGPGVSKTASGAEETVSIAVVANLANAISQLKEANFWVIGAAHDPQAKNYHEMDYKMPTVLIMGSEDKGLGNLIQKNCDFLVKIPMHGTVESLNVATATAVILFEIVKPGS